MAMRSMAAELSLSIADTGLTASAAEGAGEGFQVSSSAVAELRPMESAWPAPFAHNLAKTYQRAQVYRALQSAQMSWR